MACLITISLPLFSSNFSFKELQPRKAILAGQSSQGTTRRATNHLAPCSQSRVACSVNQHGGRYSTNAFDHFGELVSCSTNLLAPCSQSRVAYSVNQHAGRYSTNAFDHFGELVSCCTNVSSRTHETLIGYWVGPESDDGWGYVEAFVNQIT